MTTRIRAFAFGTILTALFSALVLSTSSAQGVGVVDEQGNVEGQETRIGVMAVGWGQFADINQRKFEDGSFIKLYDISEWRLSETWATKISDNLSSESFESLKLKNIDIDAMLAAYENDLNAESNDWATLSPRLQEIAATNELDHVLLFAPAENTISATTIFGEISSRYPGGVGIMRYNRSGGYCYVSGTLYLFDGKTGRLQNQIRLQEDFGFMKPSAFFFQLKKGLRRATFADYSAEQKSALKREIETSFDKHFHNSVSRLVEAERLGKL
jgi:hypothetical protein